jgi:hypothetical protein
VLSFSRGSPGISSPILFTTKITKDAKGSGKGGFETRPYNFVLFVSFVVKIYLSTLVAALPR